MALAFPLPGGSISQHFGRSPMRIQPSMFIVGDEQAWWQAFPGAVLFDDVHAGTDFAGMPAGSPLVAMEAGRVTRAEYDGDFGGGNVIDVEVTPDVRFSFNHCQSLLKDEGAIVKKGATIATVGATGTIKLPNGTRIRSTYGTHAHINLIDERVASAIRFRNIRHFMVGGKYEGHPMIRPAKPPTYKTVRVNSGVNIRRAAVLDDGSNIAYVTRDTGIFTKAGRLAFKAGSAFYLVGTTTNAFGGWGKLQTHSGERLFVAAGRYH